MIIQSSTVAMASSHSYSSIREEEKVTLNENSTQAVKLEISEESKSLMAQIKDYKDEQKKKAEQQQQQNVADLLEQSKTAKASSNSCVPQNKADGKIEMLKKLLEAMQRAIKGKLGNFAAEAKRIQSDYENDIWDTGNSGQTGNKLFGGETVIASGSSSAASASTSSTRMMTRTTVTSGFFAETEVTAFTSQGIAKTTDGREISFGVTVEMSRGFSERYESLAQEDYLYCDPLVINLDSDSAGVTDMKFMFDLDTDGEQEEISFAGQGSGFLALDRNGDGKINDGSELFGTKSGDGFADLAAYDEDGNGWIDEADSIFKDLKVWTKDDKGNDVLIDLKQADVGAIYLGNADTQFSLNNLETNKTNGAIRKTGVYLKEHGGVGTVQHVDLAV